LTARCRKNDFNPDWEKEIGKFDAECELSEREFRKRHLIIGSDGKNELAPEENDVLTLYLSGMSLEAIAEQNQVELELVTGLMEIIKAKLSLNDK
jgi:hypothetical protein